MPDRPPPHEVVQVRPTRCPGSGNEWPLAVYGRPLVDTHKCPNDQHRTCFCQKCKQTAIDPPRKEGCREVLRMGVPNGGLNEQSARPAPVPQTLVVV